MITKDLIESWLQVIFLSFIKYYKTNRVIPQYVQCGKLYTKLNRKSSVKTNFNRRDSKITCKV